MKKEFNSERYQGKYSFNQVEQIRIEKIVKLIGKNKKVLDIGCGDGFITERIQKAKNKVDGVEISRDAVNRARRKGFKVYCLTLNSNWAGKIKDKYDVVFAGEIIEHIFDTDKILDNIRKVLKKNGVLVMSTPNIASLGRRLMLLFGKSPIIETTARKNDAGHIRYFTQANLMKLVEENGFKVISIESTVVNFGNSGNNYSKLLAKLLPRLGNNIILKAILRD